MLKRIFAIICVGLALGTGSAFATASPAEDAEVLGAVTREAPVCGETAEKHLPADQPFEAWLLDPEIFEEDQGDRTEMREVLERDVKTIKLANLVPPIHFREGEAEIPEDYLERLRSVLERMRGRKNVRLHFVGHADSQRLSGTLRDLYGDNVGLSRERAGTTAEYCQNALDLPPEAISYEGVGDSQPITSNATDQGRAMNRRVEVEVWYDEITERLVEKEVIVPRQVNRVKVCRTETVCKLRYKAGHSHRAKIRNLVAPMHYDQGMVSVPEDFLRQVDQARKNLSGKKNIVVRFIAYTDNTPLAGREKRIYGDHRGLSKAVARRVSLAVQEALGLPQHAIEGEGRGATRPVASNETPHGRALNRRVEVEFWHDDPLQDLPDEPQICPDAAGAETVARVYEPPAGPIEPILFENGNPVIPPGYTERLQQIMTDIKDKTRVRLRFVGYISNERLDRRTAAVYGDDIGWSTVRARRAMTAVSETLGLTDAQTEFEGRGYVQSSDVVNAGFIAADTSRVEVQVVYDELVALDDYDGVEIRKLSREVRTANPFSLNQMRITVDGKPVDDPGKSIPDVQRCTDVALERARVRFKYDNLVQEPKLNVTAWPRTIRYRDDAATPYPENLVRFRLYTNYHSVQSAAEVRLFEQQQSVRSTPLAVLPMDDSGMARWQPELAAIDAPVRELKYVVRVYDKTGHFDETSPQPLWVADRIDPAVAEAKPDAELLAGYGESRLAMRTIELHGGTVRALGEGIPEDHRVWLAGYPVPVDQQGKFIAEEILPQGMHTVEVAVLDESGNGELFLRDLALDREDWFTVGLADLTLSANNNSGPADLVASEKDRYSDDMSVEGRLAFFTKGKFADGWGLKASADTREGPLDEIFSNALDKSPEAFFRRLDPEDHAPTYGDDSTVEEEAPTRGKFYLKLSRDDNFALWGNSRVGYTDTDLAHVDRALYGARLHYQADDITSFGERRFAIDGFAAEPGTVAGRDEFRGTGGSLYFLQRQDVLEGSERLRVEVRDKDSGMVLGVKNLTPGLDYDIDYLQGRVLLAQTLSPSADDDLLVHTDSISGHPVFLVVRYEFTPGFDEPDTLTAGGRVHYWAGEHVKFGATVSQDDEAARENSLQGADVTLRKTTETWIKVEAARTEGSGQIETASRDGGFNFDTREPADDVASEAGAWRADASLGFQDLWDGGSGRMTLYGQRLEAGYSAPGLLAAKETQKVGGTLDVPVAEPVDVRLKVDKLEQEQGLTTEAGELNLDVRVKDNWTVSSGVRHDRREDRSSSVPQTQKEGKRTDAVLRLTFDSHQSWSTYGFVQETLASTGNREDNARVGAGGSYRFTDRFKMTGEVSAGDQGTGGQVGSEFLYSDRTTLYLNYALENERSDNGLRARKGNMTSGVRTRYSDSASVYLEERYTHGDIPTGLMHSAGVDLAPTDRLNLGANVDIGTLEDNLTGAELERKAAGVNIGYGFEHLKIASALEYRVDETEQPDTSTVERTTWLMKNSLRYQLFPDWRLLGHLNLARSDSSQGQFFDGEYTEAVVGYAYRPVENDRLNALLKYTYFTDTPTVEQRSGTRTGAGVAQRSHIAAIDATYSLSARWALGAKYAYRYGEVSLDRDDPVYFKSRAHLYVLRADWHILHRWDALVEGRMLELPDAEDRLTGALVALYRHVGNHVKVGMGYNFSKFSDDLTDFDYDHQGLFINIVGKY